MSPEDECLKARGNRQKPFLRQKQKIFYRLLKQVLWWEPGGFSYIVIVEFCCDLSVFGVRGHQAQKRHLCGPGARVVSGGAAGYISILFFLLNSTVTCA